jgi:2Fe-2S ferredoxin
MWTRIGCPLPAPDALEAGMLDCALERRPNSRLSCQIRMREDLDGLVVRVPDAQI